MSHPQPPQHPHVPWQQPPPAEALLQPVTAPYGRGTDPYPRPQTVTTNGLAIASLVLGILWLYWLGSLLAVVFGHVALHQVRHDPYQGGRGLAVAGLVLGYLGLGALLAVVVLLVVAALSVAPSGPAAAAG